MRFTLRLNNFLSDQSANRAGRFVFSNITPQSFNKLPEAITRDEAERTDALTDINNSLNTLTTNTVEQAQDALLEAWEAIPDNDLGTGVKNFLETGVFINHLKGKITAEDPKITPAELQAAISETVEAIGQNEPYKSILGSIDRTNGLARVLISGDLEKMVQEIEALVEEVTDSSTRNVNKSEADIRRLVIEQSVALEQALFQKPDTLLSSVLAEYGGSPEFSAVVNTTDDATRFTALQQALTAQWTKVYQELQELAPDPSTANAEQQQPGMVSGAANMFGKGLSFLTGAKSKMPKSAQKWANAFNDSVLWNLNPKSPEFAQQLAQLNTEYLAQIQEIVNEADLGANDHSRKLLQKLQAADGSADQLLFQHELIKTIPVEDVSSGWAEAYAKGVQDGSINKSYAEWLAEDERPSQLAILIQKIGSLFGENGSLLSMFDGLFGESKNENKDQEKPKDPHAKFIPAAMKQAVDHQNETSAIESLLSGPETPLKSNYQAWKDLLFPGKNAAELASFLPIQQVTQWDTAITAIPEDSRKVNGTDVLDSAAFRGELISYLGDKSASVEQVDLLLERFKSEDLRLWKNAGGNLIIEENQTGFEEGAQVWGELTFNKAIQEELKQEHLIHDQKLITQLRRSTPELFTENVRFSDVDGLWKNETQGILQPSIKSFIQFVKDNPNLRGNFQFSAEDLQLLAKGLINQVFDNDRLSIFKKTDDNKLEVEMDWTNKKFKDISEFIKWLKGELGEGPSSAANNPANDDNEVSP